MIELWLDSLFFTIIQKAKFLLDYIYDNHEKFKTNLNKVLDIVLAFILSNSRREKLEELIQLNNSQKQKEIRNVVKSMNNDEFKVCRGPSSVIFPNQKIYFQKQLEQYLNATPTPNYMYYY